MKDELETLEQMKYVSELVCWKLDKYVQFQFDLYKLINEPEKVAHYQQLAYQLFNFEI